MSLQSTRSGACLIILCFLVALSAGPEALAAVSGQEAFYLAVKEFEALNRERQRGMRRDSWENLEKRFADIQARYPDLAPEALFYRGRALEELGDRSKKKDDYQAAHDRYADLARLYSSHPLADNACFNQAVLLAVSLHDDLAALKRLDALIESYPESDLFTEAIALRERLRGKKPPTTPVAPPVATKPQAKEALSGPRGNEAAQGTPSPPSSTENVPNPKTEAQPQDADDEAAARQARLYAEAAARWRELLADKDKAVLRENWLKLEKDFLAVQAVAPWGDTAAKAAYQAARCRGELAARSGSKDDWLRAKELFEDTAKAYPEHALADDALYSLTEIHMSKLKQMEEGRRAALDLIRLYPAGDMRLKTEKLLQRHAPRAERAVPPKAASGANKGATGATLLEQLGLTMKTIMVDAGHGGYDPGAVGNGLRESRITLDLTQKLGEQLSARGFKVIYSRSSDSAIKLPDRTSMANNKNVDLFISIHVNSNTNKELSGLETYYLDVARSDAAEQVAARENGVAVTETNYAQLILTELNMNNKKDESLAVARLVQHHSMLRLKQAGFKVRDNGVRSALLHVLAGARMPAILVEIGYLSNSTEAVRLKNPKYLQALAAGICDGVAAYRTQVNALGRK